MILQGSSQSTMFTDEGFKYRGKYCIRYGYHLHCTFAMTLRRREEGGPEDIIIMSLNLSVKHKVKEVTMAIF